MLSYFQGKSFFKFLSSLFLPAETDWKISNNYYLDTSKLVDFAPRIKPLEFQHQANVLEYLWVCSDYHDPKINELLRRAKISGEWKIAATLAKIIEFQFRNEIQPQLSEKVKFPPLPKPDLITYVSADKKRYLMRGYHLPFKISHYLGQDLSVKLINLTKKSKHTISQTSLIKTDRLQNLNDVFEIVNPRVELTNQIIWLVDDLTTTGTTIYEVAKVIKAAFPDVKIIGVAVAGN